MTFLFFKVYRAPLSPLQPEFLTAACSTSSFPTVPFQKGLFYRVDIDSLCHVPSTVNSEASFPVLNMEEEVLDFVDNELSEAVLDKKGKGLASDKLASKLRNDGKTPAEKELLMFLRGTNTFLTLRVFLFQLCQH